MKVRKHEIINVIPQRAPFVMIDNVVQASAEKFESDFFITEDNIFSKEGKFLEPGLIENIAQTCAAGFGYMQGQANSEPKQGFIGAVTKLVVHTIPPINSKILTKVEVIHQMENVFLVKGENFIDNEKLLECEMKIVIM